MSFAIPTQEIIRLNPSKRPATWEQLTATARPDQPARLIEPRFATGDANEEQTDAGSFTAFRKRLNDYAGKPVTIVVQEEGRTNIFKFTGR